MNIHENMLRQIILKTIQGVKNVGSGIKKGAETVVGAMAKVPPEEIHSPFGIKQGMNPLEPLTPPTIMPPKPTYTVSGIRMGKNGPLERFR